MKQFARTLALTSLALAVSAAFAGPRQTDRTESETGRFSPSELRASVSSTKSFHVAGDRVKVTVEFSNSSLAPAHVPAWLLDSSDPDRSFLRVTRDGEELAYMGALVKRKAAYLQDTVEIQPGQSISVTYDIDRAYDLSEGGSYQINFVGSDKHVIDGHSFDSQPAGLAVEADPARAIMIEQSEFQHKLGTSSYAASCTTSQRSAIDTALSSAAAYASNAVSYLAQTPSSARTRYVTWFGAVTTSRWNTVASNFANIKNTFDTQNMSFDCGCTEAGTFAYVYPTQPYKVYLCGAFWSAANTGTDSRAGTLVHETSHFNVVAGTNDYAYGQTAAKKLATTNPKRAIQNADSHEYFAENTPFQN